MSDSSQPSRPQQVTTAVVLSVTACVLAVVNLFNTRAELRGTGIRDAITEAQEGVGGIVADEDLVVEVLNVLVFVSGALAAAAAVLAVYAWQRNRAAWIGFFVLAALLALTLPVAGVLPVLLLASGATFLASRPARAWFADPGSAASGPRAVLAQEGPRDSDVSGQRPEPPPWPGQYGGGDPAGAAPGPVAGPTGQPEPPPTFGPWHGGPDPAAGHPSGGHGQPYGGGAKDPFGQADRDPDKRPGTVTAACVTTWVGSALVTVITALVALVLLSDQGSFVREFRRQADLADLDVTRGQVLAVTWTMIGLGLLWCLLAAVLAVLAFRRSRGGRIALAVSAALTVLVSLLLILSVVAALPLLLGIAVLVLLFTGGANDWYARRSGWPPGGSPYGGQPPSYGEHPPYGQQPPPYGQQLPPYGQQPPHGQPPPPRRSSPW